MTVQHMLHNEVEAQLDAELMMYQSREQQWQRDQSVANLRAQRWYAVPSHRPVHPVPPSDEDGPNLGNQILRH